MTTHILNPEAATVIEWRHDRERSERPFQIAFYNFDPNSPDAFPGVEHRTFVNLTRRQATVLMAELAQRISDDDMTDYYGTRATVTVNLDNDGLEAS